MSESIRYQHEGLIANVKQYKDELEDINEKLEEVKYLLQRSKDELKGFELANKLEGQG